MRYINFGLILIIVLFTNCNKKHEIIGQIVSNGIGVKSDLTILKEGEINNSLYAISEYDGHFIINEISSGTYKVEIITKHSSNESHVQKTVTLEVNGDEDIGEIEIYKSVDINFELDSTNNNLTLKWNKSDAEDFSEYKLYSKINNMFSASSDQPTKEIFSTNNINDTIFSIKMKELFLVNFFVRSFNNKQDLITESETLIIESLNIDRIKDNNLKETNTLDKYWHIESGQFHVVPLLSYNDLNKIEKIGSGTGIIYQNILPCIPNALYKLTFDYDVNSYNYLDIQIDLIQNGISLLDSKKGLYGNNEFEETIYITKSDPIKLVFKTKDYVDDFSIYRLKLEKIRYN